MNLLAEVFRPSNEPILEGETRKDRLTLRNNALYVSIAALTANAVIAFVSLQQRSPLCFRFLLSFAFPVLVLDVFAFLRFALSIAALANSCSPRNWPISFPLLPIFFRSDETHRFLLITFPLTFLAFAYFIVMDFPSFASDIKYNRSTLLTRLGWERVVPLHHLFVLLAYLFFLASPCLWSFAFPPLACLPHASFCSLPNLSSFAIFPLALQPIGCSSP